jgi:hypothetical protein
MEFEQQIVLRENLHYTNQQLKRNGLKRVYSILILKRRDLNQDQFHLLF